MILNGFSLPESSLLRFEYVLQQHQALKRLIGNTPRTARLKHLVCILMVIGMPAPLFAACPTTPVMYEYYERNANSIPNTSTLTATTAGTQGDFSLSSVTLSNSYGFRFTTTISVPADNTYTFYSGANTHSKISIDGEVVLDNLASSDTAENSATTTLSAGEHSLQVLYFANSTSEYPSLYWSSSSIQKTPLGRSINDTCGDSTYADEALLNSANNNGSYLYFDDTSVDVTTNSSEEIADNTTESSAIISGTENTPLQLGLVMDPTLLAGGSQLDLIDTNVGFRASNAGTTPILFNIPENATFVRITGMGASDSSSVNTVEEDYQFTSITVDLANGIYSGHTAYIVSQNSGNDNYAFSNVELGLPSNSAHVSGDTSDSANTITLSRSGSTLSLVETQSLMDQGYMAEFLTSSGSSSIYLGADSLVIERGVLTDTLELPTDTDFSILSILQASVSSTSSDDEDKAMGYITIDVETMQASGVIYAHVGSGNENVSSYAFSDYSLNSGLPLLSSNAHIVGDKLATDDALPNLTLFLSDNKLSITRPSAMANIYSALYSSNSYQRLAQSSSARFLGNSAVSGEFSDNAEIADTFDLTVPDNAKTGQASLIMYNPTGNNSSNENSGIASFSIDLDNQTTSGSFISMRQITPDFVSWNNVPFGTRLIDHPDTVSNHSTESEFTDQISGVLKFDLITHSNGTRTLRALVQPTTGIGESYTRYKVTIGGQWAEHMPIEVTASVVGGTLSHGAIDPESGLWTIDPEDLASLVFTPSPGFSGSAGSLSLSYNDITDVVLIDIAAADTPVINTVNQTAVQNSPLDLSNAFFSEMADQEGAENLNITLTITPTHSVSDGINVFIASIGNETVDISSWNTSALSYYSPDFGVYPLLVHRVSADSGSSSSVGELSEKTETFSITILADADSNGVADIDDSDDDGDGIPDNVEGEGDSDNDGIVDSLDMDSDNDGLPDILEGKDDTDGDGILDAQDLDSDNDGIPDLVEAGAVDADGDGRIDDYQDANSDGVDDAIAVLPLLTVDTDNDGVPDNLDLDADNDSIPDTLEAGLAAFDLNADGQIDSIADGNGDGWPDDILVQSVLDTDTDGLADYQDLDSNGDGVSDLIEAGIADSNGDGIADGWEDVDADGILDSVDADQIENAQDIDGDGIADFADADFLAEIDSDGDGIAESFDLDPLGNGFANLQVGELQSGLVSPNPAGGFGDPQPTVGDGSLPFDLDSGGSISPMMLLLLLGLYGLLVSPHRARHLNRAM